MVWSEVQHTRRLMRYLVQLLAHPEHMKTFCISHRQYTP